MSLPFSTFSKAVSHSDSLYCDGSRASKSKTPRVTRSTLLSIPTDTIDAARVDGVNYFQRLIYVYIPQMIPSIMIASIICLIGSFGVFDEPVGMGAFYGNKSVWYLSVVVYRFGFGVSTGAQQAGRLSEAVTMSMVVYVPLIVLAFLLTRLQKRLQY